MIPPRPLAALMLLAAAFALPACAKRSEPPPELAAADDDAACRAAGAPGSDPYVACRKNRDVQRLNAEARRDRAQRNLGEHMLNNPSRPF